MTSRSAYRAGMQVHAVPEPERAIGANGQRLPWAYEYAEPDRASHLDTREKGPFGRSTRRRTPSRSKTATPSRREDKDSTENWRAIDDIFLRKAREDEQNRELARSTSAVATNTAGSLEGQDVKISPAGTPTEVILYGFAPVFQYAAIEFYERVSQGVILEDYDRLPPNPRYDNSLSLHSSRGPLKLSRDALRKKNTHRGGDHWIKVTFDSAEAADAACAASPHTLNGYLVFAESYRGDGPSSGDVAIMATAERLQSATASPSQNSQTQSSRTAYPPAESDTATSATMTVPVDIPDSFGLAARAGGVALRTTALPIQNTSIPSSMMLTDRRTRIPGAKRVILLPADQALIPAKSRTQRFIEAVPILGWFFSGSSDIIGEGVPRKEDGTIDTDKAGFYWGFWWWIDSICGSDYCGLKGDD